MCNALVMTPFLKLSLLYNLQKGSDVVYVHVRPTLGLRLKSHGLRLTAYSLRPTACGLWLTAYGLRLADYGLQFTAYGLRYYTDYRLLRL